MVSSIVPDPIPALEAIEGRTVSRLGRSKLPRVLSTLGRALSPPIARCTLSRLGLDPSEGIGGREREDLLQLPMLLFQSSNRAFTELVVRVELATDERDEVLMAAAADVAICCGWNVGLPLEGLGLGSGA
jgi:hypothetical protein